MSIPFYDFTKIHPSGFQNNAIKRISKIIETNSFVEGEYNSKFEHEFAKMQNSKNALLVAELGVFHAGGFYVLRDISESNRVNLLFGNVFVVMKV